MPHEDDVQSIDLKEFFAVLRRRKWSVIIPTLLITGLALGWVAVRTPLYASTARVEVLPKTAQDTLAPAYGTSFANMDTESARVTSTQIEARATDLLVASGGSAALATGADVSVSVPANTTYMDIECTTGEASSAQACAEAYADAYVADRKEVVAQAGLALRMPLQTKVAQLTAKVAALDTEIAATNDPDVRAGLERKQTALQQLLASAQVTLDGLPKASAEPAQVVIPAELPTEPSNKGYVSTGILAAILGLALGIGWAFVRQRMDERVGEHEGLDATLGTPVIAVVPMWPRGGRTGEPWW